jgi:hypothetical protein
MDLLIRCEDSKATIILQNAEVLRVVNGIFQEAMRASGNNNVTIREMRFWYSFSESRGVWVEIPRATQTTKREDDVIWRRQNTSPQNMNLKRRVDLAGYRTTFVHPILRQLGRIPLETHVMRMVLSEMPRSRPPRSIPPPPLPRWNDAQPRTRTPRPPARQQTPALPRINGRTNREVTRPRTIRNGNSAHKINRNTSFIGRNFTELSELRNIPVAKRVYLNPDVTENGKIKHVYHEDGLVGWISSKSRATSPFTRRPVTISDVRRLTAA